ncbi:CAP domain-containing protein [Candidatus Gracilibacteria bacterium]|nr:CAP domain-containing protein [Candidatus Gracilibacteria bacterium]
MKILVVLKHIFIPHSENDFKPHFFRELGVSVVLFTSVFLLGSSFGSSFLIHKTVLGAEIATDVLIDLTNESRLAYNYKPLVRNTVLDQAAELKGKDMASKQYFSHNSPDGVTPWYWLRQVGYNFLYAGENLAINFTDATEVEEAWLGSPTHRANIMNAQFHEIGIATVQGFYNSYPTIYIVQMFGTPASAKSKSIELEKLQDVKTATDAKNTSVDNSELPIVGATTSLVGDVKGESVEATSSVVSNLEEIVSSGSLIIVKNNDAIEEPRVTVESIPVYSTWYEKILFKFSYYLDYIYKALLIIIAFALVTMVLVEIRKQHYIHILYGVSLLLLLTIFIYINQSFF